jgi:hypothetical protein
MQYLQGVFTPDAVDLNNGADVDAGMNAIGFLQRVTVGVVDVEDRALRTGDQGRCQCADFHASQRRRVEPGQDLVASLWYQAVGEREAERDGSHARPEGAVFVRAVALVVGQPGRQRAGGDRRGDIRIGGEVDCLVETAGRAAGVRVAPVRLRMDWRIAPGRT